MTRFEGSERATGKDVSEGLRTLLLYCTHEFGRSERTGIVYDTLQFRIGLRQGPHSAGARAVEANQACGHIGRSATADQLLSQ